MVEDIDSLTPDPANARKHNQRNLDEIMGSLRRFGQQKPIIVDRDGVVRAGNGTLLAARALGWERIAVARTNLTGAEATAYGIADNRTAELAEWDMPVLLDLLQEPDLGAVGFDESEVEKMLGDISDEATEGQSPRSDEGKNGDAGTWEVFGLMVDCPDAATRDALVERLTAEGLTVRRLERGKEVRKKD